MANIRRFRTAMSKKRLSKNNRFFCQNLRFFIKTRSWDARIYYFLFKKNFSCALSSVVTWAANGFLNLVVHIYFLWNIRTRGFLRYYYFLRFSILIPTPKKPVFIV